MGEKLWIVGEFLVVEFFVIRFCGVVEGEGLWWWIIFEIGVWVFSFFYEEFEGLVWF